MRKCEVDGCTGQHRARGFCILHYNNWVRYESGAGKFETKFRAAERERIVKLLTRMHDGLTDDSGHTVESVTIAKAIDLIEGKNK